MSKTDMLRAGFKTQRACLSDYARSQATHRQAATESFEMDLISRGARRECFRILTARMQTGYLAIHITETEQSMRYKRISSAILLVFVLLFPCGLSAGTDIALTIALSEKLNKMQMYDYSIYLLENEMKKSPADREMFSVQLARTYFAMNKEDEALRILDSSAKTGRAYTFSRFVLGRHQWQKAEYEEAAATLEDYFSKVKEDIPKPDEKRRVEQFRMAVALLQDTYKNLDDTENAVKAAEYINMMLPEKKEKTKIDLFREILFSNQVRLDIGEQLKNKGKEGWKEDIESTLGEFDKMLNADEDPTVITVLTFVEKFKALVLLEKFEEAKELLGQYKDMTRLLDDQFEKAGMIEDAPSAKMYLWIAKMNAALAQKETDKEKRIALNSKALEDFYRVITLYDIKKCPHVPAAAKGFNKTKKELEKDGKKVTASVEIPADFEIDRINAYYSQDEYNKVIPAAREYLRAENGISSEHAPDILAKLADSYLKTEKILEAISITGLMADAYPDNKNTPKLLLMLGELKWKEYKDQKDTPQGQKALEDALIVYEWYMKKCPAHKYAADICMKVAMVYYDRAAEEAMKVNEMPPGEEKARANAEAREMFSDAVPRFRYIIDNYSHTERGKDAAFLLAQCHANLHDFLKATEIYAKVCELETNYENKDKRNMGRVAEAKFRLSDNYVRYAEKLQEEAAELKKQLEKEPEPEEEGAGGADVAEIQKAIGEKNAEAEKYFNLAIGNLEELTDKWMQPGGRLHDLEKQSDKDKVREIYDRTIAYIPWIYDREGDVQQTIAAFTEFINKYPEHKSIPKALKRRAFIYLDQDDTLKATRDFDTLSSKYPEHARTIQIDRAKAMYEVGNYSKSIESVSKMFEGDKSEISVSSLKWIGRNLYDCEGKHPREGALLALKANELLLERLKKPVLAEWVSKAKAEEIEAHLKLRTDTIRIIREKLLLDTAKAAFYAGEPERGIKYLDELLKNDMTPYYYKGRFLRARLYRKLEKFGKAIQDYSTISQTAIKAKRFDVYNEAQCRTGDTYIEQGDYARALAAFLVIAVIDPEPKIQALKDENLHPEKKQRLETELEWNEYALYKKTLCHAELGEDEQKREMQARYRKFFPDGRFLDEIKEIQTRAGKERTEENEEDK